MKYLTDGDWAQNNGNWQWSAGCGCDAQPYFRVFNPITQGTRLDPEGAYVRKYVPERRELDAKYIHSPWRAPAATLARAGVRLGALPLQSGVAHGIPRTVTPKKWPIPQRKSSASTAATAASACAQSEMATEKLVSSYGPPALPQAPTPTPIGEIFSATSRSNTAWANASANTSGHALAVGPSGGCWHPRSLPSAPLTRRRVPLPRTLT